VYALLAVGVYTPLAVLADLWGVSFLVEKFNIVRADAASTTMLMYVGLAIGSLTLPALSERYNMFTRTVQICSLGLLVLFTTMLMADQLSMLALKGIFISIGILCGAEMICFSGALVGSTPRTSGLTLGFVNTMNMLAGAVLQQIIGYCLDLQWNGAVDSTGVRLYSADQYVLSLMILPAVLVGCVFLSLTLKKKDFSDAKK
jgi:sugar phosphate permease